MKKGSKKEAKKSGLKKENVSEENKDSDVNGKIEKALSESHKEDLEMKNERKKYLKILVTLIVLLVIIDVFSLIAYYKPDLSGIFKSNAKNSEDLTNNKDIDIQKCSDGTPYGECSRDKPYYCYNGDLLKKAATCGCPSGYKVDFQDCKK